MSFRERRVVIVRANANNEIVTSNSATHVARNHERKTAKHPGLLDLDFLDQDVADSLC